MPYDADIQNVNIFNSVKFHPNDAEFVYLLWIMKNVNWSDITWDVYGTFQTAPDDHCQHLKHQIRYQNSYKHDATPWVCR